MFVLTCTPERRSEKKKRQDEVCFQVIDKEIRDLNEFDFIRGVL